MHLDCLKIRPQTWHTQLDCLKIIPQTWCGGNEVTLVDSVVYE
jgi:hypothetical protein